MTIAITARNLGNIEEGSITIKKNCLNIKYGINGTGKSTLTKGLNLKLRKEDLDILTSHGSSETPTFEINGNVSNLITFNQQYVNDYLFKEDVVNNTYNIMINTPDYLLTLSQIEKYFEELITTINCSDINSLYNDLSNLTQNIRFNKLTQKSTNIQLDGTSKFSKGKKASNVDDALSPLTQDYKPLLLRKDKHEWVKWFRTGERFIDKQINNNKCPFCLSPLNEEFNTISKSLRKSLDTTLLKNNIEINEMITHSSRILPRLNELKLSEKFNSTEDFSADDLTSLKQFLNECDLEITKIHNLKSLSLTTIKNHFQNNSLNTFLNENTLDITLYPEHHEFYKITKSINDEISLVLTKSNELIKLTNDFSRNLTQRIEEKKEFVNKFLTLSGIPYKIEIVELNHDYFQTILTPINCGEKISDQHLSYGEKNAISLMFFALEAELNYELIVLDDPVSSFDNSKKYAILYYLFAMEKAIFKDKTVLLFTHDFDVIVDFCYKNNLRAIKPSMNYLINSKGHLKEISVKKGNLIYTLKKWKNTAMDSNQTPLLRLVDLRKYLQYAHPEQKHAIDIISSLEHGDSIPRKINNLKKDKLSPENIESGTNKILEYIPDFNYEVLLTEFKNITNLKDLYNKETSSLRKLQVLRMAINISKTEQDTVFWNYITEHYHVENNFMTSLDDDFYDKVPNYIMNIANEISQSIFN